MFFIPLCLSATPFPLARLWQGTFSPSSLVPGSCGVTRAYSLAPRIRPTGDGKKAPCYDTLTEDQLLRGSNSSHFICSLQDIMLYLHVLSFRLRFHSCCVQS